MPEADLPLPLSEKQVTSIVESTARINLWEGAIRSGKTVASLLRWLGYVADPPRGGQLVVAGRTRESIGRNLFGPLTDPTVFGPLAKQVHYTAGAPTADVLGRTVHVLGANDAKAEAKLRGMTCSGAYVDEVTVLPESFFRQLLGRMSVRGSRLFGTTNPDNPSHWLRRDFLTRADALNLASWRFRLHDNPHLDPDYIASLEAEFTGLWHRRFVQGEWVVAEGAVYDMFDTDRHVVSELPPLDRVVGVGVDYGTSNPFAALMLALTRDGRLVVTREYRHDPKTARRQNTDTDFTRALAAWIGDEEPRWFAVDPSAASFKLELHRAGFKSVADANNRVLDGIRLVSSLLSRGLLLVHESCTGLLNEIPGYAWDDAKAAKGEDVPIKANDHSCDALRYVVTTTQPVWRPHLREEVADRAAA
ncbi:phage terminase, large subunit, PBSX family [Haloechinothrix alba]|uniref:Phage terminase, large subunit, PBSX family n=1 Tax=Haloechinothrix alba TaxID=664784 RepID=A0A238WEZ5_9PSEU|nr:PBSX family phage terminase large subunit [Haloechinothrix alba]SNR44249.1 phage terminase, large subunit, PBSX family [Haloechinothrix alba]